MLSDIYGIIDYKKEDERRRYEENEEKKRDEENEEETRRRNEEIIRREETRRSEEETRRRNEETRRREEERIRLCKQYKQSLKDNRIKDGPTMAVWVKGKDKNSEIYKKIMKAYKFVFQDNKCADVSDGKKKKSKRKSMKKKKSKRKCY